MTSLGLVGIADKGTYSAEATYNKGQFVLYDGSTWLALKDNLNGVTPAEGENWKYLARGFAAELLSLVTAIDSQGLSGSQGGQVNAQSLIDVLADKVANQLIAKSMMSNVQVNDAEKVPTSALAYAMQQSIDTLNSKKVLEIAKTTAKSNSAGNCIFQYPTGFSQSSTLLLCVKYINNGLRPIIKNGETELWGGSIEAKNLNVQEGTEVTAFLAKII